MKANAIKTNYLEATPMLDEPDQSEVDEVFADVIELAPEQRHAFLEERCAGLHPKTKVRVQSLLALDQEAAEENLFQPVINISGGEPSTEASFQDFGIDTRIGPYRLLQKIGEGGMGIVYMADQMQPVRRRVALKVIKPGMDSKLVCARFDAERQALAMMDHPNIAKVLDGGQTERGLPYFVMELVKGTPINQYCDERRLTLERRLKLFIPVCNAVEHAHQKGVIHRDLKPSNILVAEYDSRPVAKVIDFGLAKALQQPLTEKTLFTQYGQVVGTFEYMSPEQAKLNQLDIDTRSDVYSLGVLLYELMTGDTPLDRKTLRSAAYDEMLRLIREEQPPRPSTKIASSISSVELSRSRRTDPEELTQTVKGDLDAVVMKALEKERSDRYQNCSALSADLHRFLANEPVSASPPSTWRQLKRLYGRHRIMVLGFFGVAASLVLATLISGGFWWRAENYARSNLALADSLQITTTDLRKELKNSADLTDSLEKELTTSRIKTLCGQSFEVQRSAPFVSALLALESVEMSREKLGRVLPIAHARLMNASIALPHPPIGEGKPEEFVGFFGNGRWICTHNDEHWKVYDTSLADPLASPDKYPLTKLFAISEDGQAVYTDDESGTRLMRWPRGANSAEVIATNLPESESLVVSEDGKWIATTGRNGTIYLQNLDLESVRHGYVFSHGEGKDVDYSLEFSADNRWLIGHIPWEEKYRADWKGDDTKVAGEKVLLWDLNRREFSGVPSVVTHKGRVTFARAIKETSWLVTDAARRSMDSESGTLKRTTHPKSSWRTLNY